MLSCVHEILTKCIYRYEHDEFKISVRAVQCQFSLVPSATGAFECLHSREVSSSTQSTGWPIRSATLFCWFWFKSSTMLPTYNAIYFYHICQSRMRPTSETPNDSQQSVAAKLMSDPVVGLPSSHFTPFKCFVRSPHFKRGLFTKRQNVQEFS